ncbi:hypothetical protein Ddye_026354 [Dipteronia dyeriana]|uniref:Reverse transcriptase domain-containing protein n=1 Tax=Dipteronia dyeriana TaxID=168575 RepID=A0AAD9TM09_9ROSI|nr:hypothetical protein Ddye_026354 [Dipteronia dyeriana]
MRVLCEVMGCRGTVKWDDLDEVNPVRKNSENEVLRLSGIGVTKENMGLHKSGMGLYAHAIDTGQVIQLTKVNLCEETSPSLDPINRKTKGKWKRLAQSVGARVMDDANVYKSPKKRPRLYSEQYVSLLLNILIFGGLHHPIFLEINDVVMRFPGIRRFHYEQCWADKANDGDIIRETWSDSGGGDLLVGVQEKLSSCEKQRSRVSWQKDGDQNTKFFHAKALSRRIRNRIGGLWDDSGWWHEKEKEVVYISDSYFKNIFNSSCPSDEQLEAVLNSVDRCLPPDLCSLLDSKFTADEIRVDIFQMSPSKAPGVDGFPADFFQKIWNLVGDNITRMCLDCLNNGRSVGGTNHTFLCLIPKDKKVERVADLHPISLCNVIYKCISKALANRLRKVMDNIIPDSQIAFIPGRLITDNAMVGFECMLALRRKAKGKKGFMALKLDMAKAYDRAEWIFLKGMMRSLGFSKLYNSRNMDCVTSVSYSFIFNGSIRGNIRPSRGLRQGDLLSLYLFLLCTKGFTRLIKKLGRDEV